MPAVVEALDDLNSATSNRTKTSCFREFKGAFKTAKKSILWPFWTQNPNFSAVLSCWVGPLGLPCDVWALRNLFKPKGPNQWLIMAKKLGFKVQNDRKNDFFAVLSLWVGSLAFEKVAERPGNTWHRSGHPTCPYFEEKKNWLKMTYQKLGFGVHNGRKNDFFAILSLWVGPFRLKRSQKDRASHGIALDTPHAYILKKKNWPKTGPPNLGFGVRNGPKMVRNDPNAYNLHEVKLFDQLLPTFHWF